MRMPSFLHLGREAEDQIPEHPTEHFDPAPGLAAEGIAIPQPLDLTFGQVVTDNGTTMTVSGAPFGTKDQFKYWHGPSLSDLKLCHELNAEAYTTVDGTMFFGGALEKDEDEGVNPKDLIGATKPDLSLVPPAALLHTASAMMDGAAKYGPYNWRENRVKARVYVAAAMRHLQQFLDGEDFDPISGVHHLGHASACCAILLDAQATNNMADDRPTAGAAGELIRRWTPEGKFK